MTKEALTDELQFRPFPLDSTTNIHSLVSNFDYTLTIIMDTITSLHKTTNWAPQRPNWFPETLQESKLVVRRPESHLLKS
ncbi:hypothetical protein FKM82_006008 [Ascaphus truei]